MHNEMKLIMESFRKLKIRIARSEDRTLEEMSSLASGAVEGFAAGVIKEPVAEDCEENTDLEENEAVDEETDLIDL